MVSLSNLGAVSVVRYCAACAYIQITNICGLRGCDIKKPHAYFDSCHADDKGYKWFLFYFGKSPFVCVQRMYDDMIVNRKHLRRNIAVGKFNEFIWW